MGQFLSWIRAPRDNQALQDVAIEQQSQPRQITPLPVTKGSPVKPVQFETPRPSPTSAVAGPTVNDMPTAGKNESLKGRGQTAPTPSKVTTPTPVATKSSSAGMSTNVTSVNKPRESPKGTSQSVAVNMSNADSTNVDTAKVATPAAAALAVAGSTVVKGKPEDIKQQYKKVQVEVAPPVAKSSKAVPAFDPFDALASSLPSETPAPQKPMFTGPEVKEAGVTSEKGVICGEDDRTLPPDYRYPKTDPAGMPAKPKNVPKPLSTNEALDALSAGFSPAATPKEQVKVSASAGLNFASPPARNKAPVDKKARIEAGDTFSLTAGLDAPAATKPKTDEGDPMSLDALSALGDTLAAPELVPEPPKLNPKDMVKEDKLKAEKGVLVGEREDTLPPNYRFKDKKPADLHPQNPEPSMDSGTALDILSGDFKASSTAPPKQVKDISALDALAGDFVAPPQQAFGVRSPAPPSMKPEKPVCSPVKPDPTKMTPSSSAIKVPAKPTIKMDDTMSLDALSALGDTLAGPEPVSEPTKLRPEDIVTEDKLKAEKGVRVGEREDTLAPEYRLKDNQRKDLPLHKPELKPEEMITPSMERGAGLDVFIGDFHLLPCEKLRSEEMITASMERGAGLDVLIGDFCKGTFKKLREQGSEKMITPSMERGAGLDVLVGPTNMFPGDKVRSEEIITPAMERGACLDVLIGDLHIAPSKKITTQGSGNIKTAFLEHGAGLDVFSEDFHITTCIKLREQGSERMITPSMERGAGLDVLVGPTNMFAGDKVRSEEIITASMERGAGLDVLIGDFCKGTFKKLREQGSEKMITPSMERGAGLDVLVGPTNMFPGDKVRSEEKITASMERGAGLDVLIGDFCKGTFKKLREQGSERMITPSMERGAGLDVLVGPINMFAGDKVRSEEMITASMERGAGLDVLIGDFCKGTFKKLREQGSEKMITPSMERGAGLDVLVGPTNMFPGDKVRSEEIITPAMERGACLDVLTGDLHIVPSRKFKSEEMSMPSMDSADALDILSGDFMTSSAVPAVHASGPVLCSKEISDDFALDTLADTFVAPAVAPAVKSSSSAARQLSVGTVDALDALSDTLTDTSPAPKSTPVSIKDMVKEKTIEEEKLIKMGERDDSLPPEHRPTEADKKVMAKAKADAVPKQTSMDDTTALDLLSGDFSAPSVPTAASKQCDSARKELVAPVPHTGPLQPLPGPALDSLASALLPDAPEFKPKEDKPKSKSKSRSKSKRQQQSEDPISHLSGQLSSDVVPASSTSKGGKI